MENEVFMDIFYTYALLDTRKKDGPYVYGEYSFEYEPFYIGKGKGGRFKHHLQNKKKEFDTNTLKRSIICKIIEETKNDPECIKVVQNLSEHNAFEIEKELIKLIGRRDLNLGPLANLSDGGDGQSGRIPWNVGITHSPETKAKLSKSRIGMKISQEQKIKTENSRIKNTYKLISPDGKEFVIDNLTKFSKEHNLHPSTISKVCRGLKRQHKGWTAETLIKIVDRTGWKMSDAEKIIREKNRIKVIYKVISPSGQEFVIDNLTKFSKENNLNKGIMAAVGRGLYSKHKGWTCEKIKNYSDLGAEVDSR